MTKLINGENYFNLVSFNKACEELQKKYESRLQIKKIEGAYSYSYSYRLKD